MKMKFVYNYQSKLFDLVFIKTRAIGATQLNNILDVPDGAYIKYENLPPKTKNVITNEYTEVAVKGIAYPLQIWITILKLNNKYTDEVELELFPLMYGRK